MSFARSSVSKAALDGALKGRAISPNDPEYDAARTIFMGGFDCRPAMIVRAADADDVKRTVALARETGLELAVRSGGHSSAGHSTSDGGIVLDLRDMKRLEVDADAGTAWAETGLTAAELTNALAPYGRAVGFGDTGSVGIGGITLAGGIGYLSRKYGLTIDSLLGAEIVTADGHLLQVDDRSHPDLFWAIRGGGGNFGVATRFRFRLHPVDRVIGGMLMLPPTADVIAGVASAAADAPDELSAIVNVMTAPPVPFVPSEYHGKLVVMALLCYAGDPESGARALRPFRELATPLADMVRPMRYPELFPPDDPSFHPTAVGRNIFMNEIDRSAAETMLSHLQRSDAPMRLVQFRLLGGAIARVPAGATAFPHRSVRVMASPVSFYSGAEDRPARQDWVSGLAAALDQGVPGAYVGFLADEGESRIRAAYSDATWARLAQVKKRYDPGNLFRRNQNVPPAASSR